MHPIFSDLQGEGMPAPIETQELLDVFGRLGYY